MIRMEARTNCFLMILCVGTLAASLSERPVRQKRHWIIQSFDIQEEDPGPFPKLLGTINVDGTVSIGYQLRGEGVDEDPKDVLHIDTNGDVYVKRKLDFEEKQRLRLTFLAQDTNSHVMDTRLGLEVQVLDINDNRPEFDKPSYDVTLLESTSQDTFLLTVQASDKDDRSTNNGTFDLNIVSVAPTPTDLEFYIQQNDLHGNIGFKGCLDHEKAEKFTILVEARDRGEVVRLSSTATVTVTVEDENNHMPVFTTQTATGSVKEREEKVSVLRLQVSDQDTKGTDAWKAKYTIHGDTEGAFSITTDPETNEGVLFVERPLDFERASLRNLSISVENVAPYHSCQVKGRPATGLWDVEITGPGSAPPVHTCQVTVIVEDVNDPPVFTEEVKSVQVNENVPAGRVLETFTAVDPDSGFANTFEYIKGDDPNDWVTVGQKTGQVTTTKVLDREGPNVVDGVYKVTLYAVDHGEPRLRGNATLYIHLMDQNDNAPYLEESSLDVCLSDQASRTNITASDLDGDPYNGPFVFELQGDVKGRWRIEPELGYTVSLVKENTVHAGDHDLHVKVVDLQGHSAVHRLSVTVCSCSAAPHCRVRQAGAAKLGAGAVGIALAATLLLLGLLLLALLLSCKTVRVNKDIPDEISSHLIHCNMENPGTDCTLPVHLGSQVGTATKSAPPPVKTTTIQNLKRSSSVRVAPAYSDFSMFKQWNVEGRYQQGSSVHRSATMYGGYRNGVRVNRRYATSVDTSAGSYLNRSELLVSTLNQRMCRLQAQGEELGDYAPHPYADEGNPETSSTLDAISIPESAFDTDMLLYLGPRFNTLAAICRPDQASS